MTEKNSESSVPDFMKVRRNQLKENLGGAENVIISHRYPGGDVKSLFMKDPPEVLLELFEKMVRFRDWLYYVDDSEGWSVEFTGCRLAEDMESLGYKTLIVYPMTRSELLASYKPHLSANINIGSPDGKNNDEWISYFSDDFFMKLLGEIQWVYKCRELKEDYLYPALYEDGIVKTDHPRVCQTATSDFVAHPRSVKINASENYIALYGMPDEKSIQVCHRFDDYEEAVEFAEEEYERTYLTEDDEEYDEYTSDFDLDFCGCPLGGR